MFNVEAILILINIMYVAIICSICALNLISMFLLKRLQKLNI